MSKPLAQCYTFGSMPRPTSSASQRPRPRPRDSLGRLIRIAPRRKGGKARAKKLSPATRSAIARLGYEAMLARRCTALLEALLFDVDPDASESVE